MGEKNVILCLGSSLVKGDLGFNWVQALSVERPQHEVLNYGENGSQLPGVIDVVSKGFESKPSVILVLAGGNDLSCSYGLSGLNVGRKGREPTNIEVFEKEFEELLCALSNFEAPIGVFNIKPIGEDLTSEFNDRVREYNVTLQKIISKFPRSEIIDAYTPLADEITSRTPGLKYKMPSPTNIGDIVSPARIVKVMMLRYLTLGLVSWNTLGEWQGFSMSSDGLHCNERAGAIFLRLARAFVDAKLSS